MAVGRRWPWRAAAVVNSDFGTGRTDATVSTIAGTASAVNTGTMNASDVAVLIDATDSDKGQFLG